MKVCCVLLFVIVHAVSGCIPGTVWKVDCYICSCSPQGQSQCTYKCPKECEPGTSWKKDCNWCSCTPEGRTMCTLKACPREMKIKNNQEKCKPGTRWQDDCNGCYCTADGQAICTQAGCPGDMKIKNNKGKCKPGTRWQDDCNGCYCTPDGQAICTQMGCPGDMKIKNNEGRTKSSQSPSNAKRECEPGSSYMKDCNQCFCNPDGRESCTKKLCRKSASTSWRSFPEHEKCEPGSSYMQDCNQCFCTSDGREMCTKKLCRKSTKSSQRSLIAHRGASTSWRSFPEHENEESSEKLNQEERNQTSPGTASTEQPTTSQTTPEAGTTERTSCEPGSAWAIDCKFCICTAAGMEICNFECGGPEESKNRREPGKKERKIRKVLRKIFRRGMSVRNFQLLKPFKVPGVNDQKHNALRRRSHFSFFHDSKPFSKLGRRGPHAPLKLPNGSRQMREWGKPALMSSGGNA